MEGFMNGQVHSPFPVSPSFYAQAGGPLAKLTRIPYKASRRLGVRGTGGARGRNITKYPSLTERISQISLEAWERETEVCFIELESSSYLIFKAKYVPMVFQTKVICYSNNVNSG